MIAVEIDQDLLAAIIGGIAIVVVATLPLLWKHVGQSRREARDDLLSLRERIDLLIEFEAHAGERRKAEHEELKTLLQTLISQRANPPRRGG